MISAICNKDGFVCLVNTKTQEFIQLPIMLVDVSFIGKELPVTSASGSMKVLLPSSIYHISESELHRLGFK